MLANSFIRGFTLVELLVVITIMGMLAAIALVTLQGARDRGVEANIKANLTNGRSQAEVFYVSNGNNYEGVCLQGSTYGIWRFVQESARTFGKIPKTTPYDDSIATLWNTEECHDAVGGYAAWVPVRSSANGSPRGWCVDSKGTSELKTAVLAPGATQCP